MLSLDIHKAFPGLNLNVKLGLPIGKITGLNGPSGTGKSTLFKLIAGLSPLDAGTISFQNTLWNKNSTILVPPQQRNCGIVFQNYVLFPHLSIEENIRFGTQTHDQNYYQELVNTLEIDQYISKNITVLSGGQQQRIAIARALFQSAKILLLDEPFTALDSRLKEISINLILTHQIKYPSTIIIASHDLDALKQLTSNNMVLDNGQIYQETL